MEFSEKGSLERCLLNNGSNLIKSSIFILLAILDDSSKDFLSFLKLLAMILKL
jgi:hypothetical protein